MSSIGTAQLYDAFLSKEFIKQYEYKGFDVEEFRKHLINTIRDKIKNRHKIWLAPENSIACDGPEGMQSLIHYLIMLYNLRGNNISNIMKGLPEQGRTNLESIVSTLEIKNKVSDKEGEARNTLTITLSRIAAAFPVHAVGMARCDAFKRKMIDLSDVGINQEQGWEKAIAHPMAASLLLKEHYDDGWLWITYLCSIRMNKLIGKKGAKDVHKTQWIFHKAMLCSKAASDQVKMEFWGGLDIPKGIIEACEAEVKRVAPAEITEEIDSYSGCDRKDE